MEKHENEDDFDDHATISRGSGSALTILDSFLGDFDKSKFLTVSLNYG